MTDQDPFDQWWEWVTKGCVTDFQTIPAEIRDAVMMLTPEERKDRAIVKEIVRTNEPVTSGRQCGSTWGAEGGGVREGLRAAGTARLG